MGTTVHPAFTLTWDPAERLATCSLPGAYMGGEEARALIEALRGLAPAGEGGGATRVLFLSPAIVSVDAEWRSLWARFFREHARTMTIAIVGISPVLRVMLRMYSVGTGMNVRAFEREEEARAWLTHQAAHP